ncbi:MAG: low affinity iron permease family protein [Chitinophagaceae bacterium]|nr:low affinity iron permease family protein [Chitinophagaceae bacterium]
MKHKKVESKNAGVSKFFNRFSNIVTKATGKPIAFIMAVLIILVWGITGPIFHFSDTWQLVINTGTTIITFLMVFVIQHSQNKDTTAIQLKLNELIAANSDASNRLVAIEDLTEHELETIKKYYTHLSESAKTGADVYSTHSLDEAKRNSASKSKGKSHLKHNHTQHEKK